MKATDMNHNSIEKIGQYILMNYKIAGLNQAVRGILAKLPPPNSRNLWLATARLVVWHNLWIHYTTQHNMTMLVFTLLCWWGALTCMEDRLETLNPSPSWPSAVAGIVLLLWCLLRTAVIYDWDVIINILPVLSTLALAFLCCPIRRIREFWQQVFIMTLIPINILLTRIHPERQLSELNASLSTFWLQSLGLDAISKERIVAVGDKAVRVAGACNGFEQIAQVVSIAVIFLLAFPLRKQMHRMFLLVMAVVIGILTNSTRISLLVLLTSPAESHNNSGRWWFDFFHEGEGSLVFSAVAVTLFAMLYLKVLDRELGPPSQTLVNQAELEQGDG